MYLYFTDNCISVKGFIIVRSPGETHCPLSICLLDMLVNFEGPRAKVFNDSNMFRQSTVYTDLKNTYKCSFSLQIWFVFLNFYTKIILILKVFVTRRIFPPVHCSLGTSGLYYNLYLYTLVHAYIYSYDNN